MKLFLICILSIISHIAFAKDFKKDWKNFKAPKQIEVQLEDDTFSFLDKPVKGVLTFKERNTNHYVSYYAYPLSSVDSTFRKNEHLWLFVQNCLTVINDGANFESFVYKDFFYLLKPCNSCKTTKRSICESLATAIIKFTGMPDSTHNYNFDQY